MCTAIRFTDAKGRHYFGRNLDWECGFGETVLTTPRNWTGTWAFEGAIDPGPAVMGIGIAALDTPLDFDCMYEAGLTVGGLLFAGFAQYETGPVEGKTNVASYEFPLWVARNFTTVDQAEAALGNVAIVGVDFAGMEPSLLHWMICDDNRSIVVEYTCEGMQIFDNTVDVLANQPGFAWHLENLRSYFNVSPQVPAACTWTNQPLEAYGTGAGMRGLPGDYYSTSRFVRAAYLNAHYPVKDDEASNAVRLFRTLGGVSMIEGASIMKTGNMETTVYTSGYSSAHRSCYYSTYEDPAIKTYRFDDFDLESAALQTA